MNLSLKTSKLPQTKNSSTGNRLKKTANCRFQALSSLIENIHYSFKNFQKAIDTNRFQAIRNSEQVFRHRQELMRAIPHEPSISTELNFRDAMINKSKLDYCEHRCAVNAKLLSLSQKLAALNKEFLDLNDEICQANEAVVAFNVQTIQQNTQWIESGIDASEATAESNEVLTSENAARVLECNEASRGFEKVASDLLAEAAVACSKLDAQDADINARRLRINENHDMIQRNQAAISVVIGGPV
jgi:hypothetical protein